MRVSTHTERSAAPVRQSSLPKAATVARGTSLRPGGNVLRMSDKPISVRLHNQPVGGVAAELRRQLGVPGR